MFNMFKVYTITFMAKSNSHKYGSLLLKCCGWILFFPELWEFLDMVVIFVMMFSLNAGVQF